MSQLKLPITDRDHVRGPEEASIVLVEYGDYQCPFSAESESSLRLAERTLSSQIKRVFRHFPITQVHEYSFVAAMSAEAAGLQGKFWEMHELLFENQFLLGPDSFEEFALELKLDLQEFRDSLLSKTLANRIKQDFMSGVRSGVNGTPCLFLNGEKYEGPIDPNFLIDQSRYLTEHELGARSW